jgi:hypothetical protein
VETKCARDWSCKYLNVREWSRCRRYTFCIITHRTDGGMASAGAGLGICTVYCQDLHCTNSTYGQHPPSLLDFERHGKSLLRSNRHHRRFGGKGTCKLDYPLRKTNRSQLSVHLCRCRCRCVLCIDDGVCGVREDELFVHRRIGLSQRGIVDIQRREKRSAGCRGCERCCAASDGSRRPRRRWPRCHRRDGMVYLSVGDPSPTPSVEPQFSHSPSCSATPGRLRVRPKIFFHLCAL